jgi:hypothetical protein
MLPTVEADEAVAVEGVEVREGTVVEGEAMGDTVEETVTGDMVEETATAAMGMEEEGTAAMVAMAEVDVDVIGQLQRKILWLLHLSPLLSDTDQCGEWLHKKFSSRILCISCTNGCSTPQKWLKHYIC